MAEAQTIEARIREFILKQFPLARKQGIGAGDKWLEAGLLDSLGILDLIHFLEQDFSIHVADEELQPDNFQSLEAVADFVRRKRNGTS
jgi:acyl carrier protein